MPNSYGLNRSLGGAIGAIALITLASSCGVLLMLNSLAAATDARGHSYRVLTQLTDLRVAMLDQETGLRGYLLNADPNALQPYRSGVASLSDAIGKLHSLVTNDPDERDGMVAAETAARNWQQQVAAPIIAAMANPAQRGAARALGASAGARAMFDRFRNSLGPIQDREQQLLAQRRAETKYRQQLALAALWAGTIITLLICASIGWFVLQRVSQPLLALAEAMRRLAGRDLTVQIPNTARRNEVGVMARAVQVFKNNLIELDRTALLRVTADTLPALIGYIDAERHIGFLNGEFDRWFDLHVSDVAEVYGRPLREVFTTTSFPGADLELETALRGTEARFERQLLNRQNAWRDIEAVYRPHRAPNGTVRGVVTLLTDITERKAMDRRLIQHARDLARSNEELEQFAYVASHDLKAPLRGIENLVSWIEEDLEGKLEGDTLNNMALLKNRVQRLESLLNDLLEYSRAGRRPEAAEAVDTHALAAEVAALSSPPPGFAIEAAETLPTLEAPRAPLTQVFQNLIGNALKHHDRPTDGRIRVDGAVEAGTATFTVTDDGPGIPERFRERVFGMFQTLRPRDEVEGSGMGLAIVRKLIDRQGGRISLEDGGGGRGLTVRFTWPADAKETRDGADGEPAPGR